MGSDDLRRACAVAVLALLAGCGAEEAQRDGPAEGARVASARDGDTILLLDGRRVRLVQVDAPELVNECYGPEAARELAGLAPPGASIRLERDAALDDRDVHGRLLRYASVAGRNVGLELVRRGAAAPYFYRGEQGRHARELERAAQAARAGRIGLWRACPSARLDPRRAVATGPAR